MCVISALFQPQRLPKEQLPETLVLLTNFLRLVQNVKQHLKLNQVEVLCCLVECLISAIVIQKKGIDLQSECENDPDENLSTPYQLTDIPEMAKTFQRTVSASGIFYGNED